jgi:hypothetical protein
VAALAGTSSGQSVPLSLLDVPFISQSEALCGGAAAAMVLRYWGERGLNAESFAHLLDRSAAGIRTQALLSEVRSRGWTALALDGTDEAIDAELQRGRPVLTLIQDRPSTFHYIVIVGTTPAVVVSATQNMSATISAPVPNQGMRSDAQMTGESTGFFVFAKSGRLLGRRAEGKLEGPVKMSGAAGEMQMNQSIAVTSAVDALK